MATAPARKTPSRASSAVTLDLDALEREQSFSPFTIKANGKTIALTDPRELDWQTAARLSPQRPFEFFEEVVPEPSRKDFFAAHFPSWKMEVMIDAYRKHFGLDDEGN